MTITTTMNKTLKREETKMSKQEGEMMTDEELKHEDAIQYPRPRN